MSFTQAKALIFSAFLLCSLCTAALPGDRPQLDAYGDLLPDGARLRLGTMRLRHHGWRLAVVFSQDGKTIITSNEDANIRFWEVASGKLLHTLRKADDGLQTIALSPDGKTLAAGSYHGVQLWNAATREPMRKLKAGSIRSLAFSPDGKTLVSGGADHDTMIRVWDLATGKERRRMKWHDHEVTYLLVADDNRTLISVSSGGRKVHLADLETGEESRTIKDRSWTDLNAALLFPDKNSLLLGGSRWRKVGGGIEGMLELYDLTNGARIRSFDGHDRIVTGAVPSLDGRTLFSSDYGGNVRVWDFAAGKELRCWKSETTVKCMSPDGKVLAVAGRGGSIQLWDVQTSRPLHNHEGLEGYVQSLAFGPDGKTLASCSREEDFVRLWDLTNGKQIRTLIGHQGNRVHIRGVRFLPDGTSLITGASDSTLRLWDPLTGNELRKFQLPGRQQVLSMGVSPDGKLLACCSMGFEGREASRSFTVFDIGTAKELVSRQEKTTELALFSPPEFAPDGKTSAENADRGLVLRDLTTGKEVGKFEVPDIPDGPIVFSPDSKTLAVGCSTQRHEGQRYWRDDFKVRLFDVAAKKETLAFAVKDWRPRLVFSPDRKTLAVAAGNVIQLFDTATGKGLWHAPESHTGISTLAFSADGSTLASGHFDSSILIWDIPSLASK